VFLDFAAVAALADGGAGGPRSDHTQALFGGDALPKTLMTSPENGSEYAIAGKRRSPVFAATHAKAVAMRALHVRQANRRGAIPNHRFWFISFRGPSCRGTRLVITNPDSNVIRKIVKHF